MAIGEVRNNNGTAWTTTETAGRVAPSEGPTFREVLDGGAQALVSGASAAVRALPIGPIVAASVRPTTSISPNSIGATYQGTSISPSPSGSTSAEGPGATSTAQASPGSPSIESALQRSEEMNMYMLELQTRVAAQNRAYTTYSNVLKARHDTIKSVINNIR